MMKLLDSYIGKTVISTGGMTVSMLLAYLFHVIMVRMLPPSLYGDLSTLVALMVIISMPVMSVQGLVSREIAKLEKKGRGEEADGIIRRYLGKSLLVGAVAAVLLSLVALGLLGLTALGIAVVLTIASTPFAYGSAIINGYFQGKEKVAALAALINAPMLFRLVIAVALVYLGFELVGATVSFPLGFLLVVFPVAMYFKWFSPGGRASINVKDSFIRILSTNILMIIFIYLDLFVVRFLLGAESAAYYNTAGITAKIPFYVSNSVVFVLLPQASKLSFKEGREILKRFLMSLAFIVPFAPVFILLSHPLLAFFYPVLYADMASGAFGILAMAMVVFGASNCLVNLLWSQRKEVAPLALSALLIPVHLGILYSLVPGGGLGGAATATLISTSIFLLLSALLVIYYWRKER